MKKKGGFFIAVGVLMILGAFLLTAYNIWDSMRAEKAAAEETEVLRVKIEEGTEKSPDNFTADETPLYVRYPEMEMPKIEINGAMYIGILRIPVLELELPVRGDFSMQGLRSAPCRYSGSAYTDDMIICGHNYSSHFGGLKNLQPGDRAEFTDGDGNVFNYIVTEIVLLDGTDVSGMKEKQENDSWDLTLFTCTTSGRQRVTVRLLKTEY